MDLGSMVPYEPLFVAGTILTFLVTLSVVVLSFPLGLAGAILRVFGARPLSLAVTVYVELVRNVPLLVVLYLLYFGLSSSGLVLSSLVCGIAGLTLNSAAYTVEIFRGGLAGIAPGQYLAATSLGMRPRQVFRHVMMPQVLRLAAPALGNQVVQVFLGSSLVSTIGVTELMYQALGIGSITFRYFEVFTVSAIIYAVSSQVVGLLWRGTTHRLLRVRWS